MKFAITKKHHKQTFQSISSALGVERGEKDLTRRISHAVGGELFLHCLLGILLRILTVAHDNNL